MVLPVNQWDRQHTAVWSHGVPTEGTGWRTARPDAPTDGLVYGKVLAGELPDFPPPPVYFVALSRSFFAGFCMSNFEF